MKNLLFLLLLASCTVDTTPVSLPHIFGDNMVLQRETPIPVWGTAGAGAEVKVVFNQQAKTAVADASGKWSLKLDAEKAGGPYTLTVRGNNEVIYKNVMVGEVWFCSGQSNMEWTVGQSMNFEQEKKEAGFPEIRHIKIPKVIKNIPQTDFDSTSWVVCDSSTVGSFTGVGYFFAKNLYKKLNVPIGLINTSWGGTNIETWTSREGFENSDEFREMIASIPVVSIDSLEKLAAGRGGKRIEKLQGSPLAIDSVEVVKSSFDDSGWPGLNQPQLWEEQSLKALDGVVWLRKTVELKESQLKPDANIELSTIDDFDETYINGVKVGATRQWNLIRNYPVPDGLLKPGKNVIVIRVTDTGGGGGIYGDPANLRLVLGKTSIPLNGMWKFHVEWVEEVINMNSFPSIAYNAMINPLIPYAFRGVIWYQGESNAGRAYQYRKAFPLMIEDWRSKWGESDFPFYYVQLATFGATGTSNLGCGWAELQEAQTMTLEVPNTGMVVTTDVGNPKDIHPTNKQTVGQRLSAIALNNVYGIKQPHKSPSFESMKVEGSVATVKFKDIGSGLVIKGLNGEVGGFEIAGSDQMFYPARAVLKDNAVLVSSGKVKVPAAVRFGWKGDNSDCNLFNKEGFPAVPFRTDDWKTITKGVKYTTALSE